MSFNFEYYTPTRIIFGRETENQVADWIKYYKGSRVLLHYGGKSAVNSGLIARVKKFLDLAASCRIRV